MRIAALGPPALETGSGTIYIVRHRGYGDRSGVQRPTKAGVALSRAAHFEGVVLAGNKEFFTPLVTEAVT